MTLRRRCCVRSADSGIHKATKEVTPLEYFSMRQLTKSELRLPSGPSSSVTRSQGVSCALLERRMADGRTVGRRKSRKGVCAWNVGNSARVLRADHFFLFLVATIGRVGAVPHVIMRRSYLDRAEGYGRASLLPIWDGVDVDFDGGTRTIFTSPQMKRRGKVGSGPACTCAIHGRLPHGEPQDGRAVGAWGRKRSGR